MNTNTKELFPLGNGCMYAVMQGLSVREIRADHFSKSFCSIEKIPESDKSDFTKSQRIHGSTHWHTRLLRVLNRDETNQQLAYVAEADDYLIANENTLIRVFNNKTTIRFKLELPEYATLTEGPVMTHDIHKAQSYFIKVRHDNYEDILQITLFGECRLDLETRTFILIPERSAMILSTGTIPGLILKSSAKALDMVIKNEISVLPLPLNEENITEVRNSVNSILSHTCTFKGIVPSSNDKYIRMLPIYTAVKLFNLINLLFIRNRDCVKEHKLFKGRILYSVNGFARKNAVGCTTVNFFCSSILKSLSRIAEGTRCINKVINDNNLLILNIADYVHNF